MADESLERLGLNRNDAIYIVRMFGSSNWRTPWGDFAARGTLSSGRRLKVFYREIGLRDIRITNVRDVTEGG